jgi:hypothetical protein
MGWTFSSKQENAALRAALVSALIAIGRQKVKQKRAFLDG